MKVLVVSFVSQQEEAISSDHVICEPVETVVEIIEVPKEVSCPSIKQDDYQKIEDYLEAQEKLTEAQEEASEEEELEAEDQSKEEQRRTIGETTDTEAETDDAGASTLDTEDLLDKEKDRQEALKTEERQILADMDEREKAQYEKDKLEGKNIQLTKKIHSGPQDPNFEEKGLLEDLAKLKALQEEMKGEDDQELEEYKKELMKQLEKTPSELEAISHFATKLQDEEEKVLMVIQTEDTESKSGTLEQSVEAEEDRKYEEIFVKAVPGIGPVVSDELVMAVEKFMRDMAKIQHGMVMPRNIRHYECPPLENVDELYNEVKLLDTHKR